MVYKIDLLNSICTDNLGGTGGHVQNITALNEWCVLAGGAGGHMFEISAYNELSTLYGGTGGYKYDIDALNEICVLSGGTGGHRFAIDALGELGALLNLLPVIPDGTPTSTFDVTDTVFKVISSVSTNSSTVVELEYGTASGVYTNTVTAAESPVIETGDVNFSLTGLTPYTNYYFRVKAVNSAGTAYSNEFVQQTDSITEVKTYITGLTTQLSSAQIGRLNTLVAALKSGLGISALSDYFDVLYILAGETAESSLRNLVKNAHYATAINSPTFTAFEGFAGNGTSSYINLNYNPSTQGINFSLNSAAIFVYIRSNVKDGKAITGGRDTAIVQLNSSGGANSSIGLNRSIGLTSIAQISAAGSLCAVRASATIERGYVNGSKVGTDRAVNSTTVPNANMFALSYGSAAVSFSSEQIAFIIYSRALSDSEVLAVHNAIEAYMDSNGKGVIS